jgi:hypothetical protein
MRPLVKSSQAHNTGFDQRKRLSLGFSSAGECASLVGNEVGGSAALSLSLHGPSDQHVLRLLGALPDAGV